MRIAGFPNLFPLTLVKGKKTSSKHKHKPRRSSSTSRKCPKSPVKKGKGGKCSSSRRGRH